MSSSICGRRLLFLVLPPLPDIHSHPFSVDNYVQI